MASEHMPIDAAQRDWQVVENEEALDLASAVRPAIRVAGIGMVAGPKPLGVPVLKWRAPVLELRDAAPPAFRVLDLGNGRRARYTLVFPENADISNGRLSILAPLGAAVLGRRREEVVEAKVPGGTRRLKIEYALYRPTRRTRSIRSRQRIWPSQDLEVGPHAAPAARQP